MISLAGKHSLVSFFPRREGAACRDLEIALVLQREALPLGRAACTGSAWGRVVCLNSGAQGFHFLNPLSYLSIGQNMGGKKGAMDGTRKDTKGV
jgi:hypothetical protein